MKNVMIQVLSVSILLVTGCVTKGTHEQTMTELDQARKATTKTATDFDTFKKQSAAQIAALEQEKTRLAGQLLAAESTVNKTQQELDATKTNLSQTLASRQDLEGEAKRLRDENSGTERLTGELRRERDLLRTKSDELETKLQAERATVESLQSDKQLLITRATTATDELARMQKRMGELETDATRAKDLEQRLSQREIEVGKLTQGGEALAAEKERLEKERAAKEAEIARLTQTQEDLTKSLQAQITKGDIKIKQVRDRLTINMVEKVLFDSGQAQVKPAGLSVLKQVGDVLKNVNDKQIRIEGHTDNVPIKGKLKAKFPTNWELSTARATNVVRYFTEQGGVNSASFEAVGYADTKPVASNDTVEGRSENRRIEIVLFPKDLSAIAGQIQGEAR